MAVSTTISAIATAVKVEMDALSASGVKNVHVRRRRTIKPSEFLTLFKGTAADIRGWTIHCSESVDEEDPAGFLFLVRRRIQIDGYLGRLESASTDTVFRDLIDVVLSRLRGNTAIFGAAPLRTDPTPTALPIDELTFGDMLCHHVLIELVVESEETVSP